MGAWYWIMNAPKSTSHRGTRPLIEEPHGGEKAVHRASVFGNPVGCFVREFETFVVEWDPRLRVPRWVLETFNAETLQGTGTRKLSEFKEDGAIHPNFRASLVSYRGSGYDRGHMAPAANHKSSQKAMDDTFVLANIAPQVGEGFNRDYWARFERFVQDLAYGICDDVYVVTGPLFLPRPSQKGWMMQYDMLGQPPRLMGIPSHFFKVVLGKSNDDARNVLGAFVIPNAPIEPNTPLAAFSVPLSALEAVAGIQFFPKLLMDDSHKESFDRLSLLWQQYGRRQEQSKKLLDKQSMWLLPPPEGYEQIKETRVEDFLSKPVRKGRFEHICEQTLCVLPEERWWEANKKVHGNGTNKNR